MFVCLVKRLKASCTFLKQYTANECLIFVGKIVQGVAGGNNFWEKSMEKRL